MYLFGGSIFPHHVNGFGPIAFSIDRFIPRVFRLRGQARLFPVLLFDIFFFLKTTLCDPFSPRPDPRFCSVFTAPLPSSFFKHANSPRPPPPQSILGLGRLRQPFSSFFFFLINRPFFALRPRLLTLRLFLSPEYLHFFVFPPHLCPHCCPPFLLRLSPLSLERATCAPASLPIPEFRAPFSRPR